MARSKKKQEPETYTITVTADQAAVLSDACELLSRIRIGQIWAALDRLPLPDGKLMIDWDTRRQIESILAPSLGFDPHTTSLGIRNPKTADAGKTAFYLYQLIRHRLSWDRAIRDGVIKEGEPRDWGKMMGVNYDEPMPFGSAATICASVSAKPG